MYNVLTILYSYINQGLHITNSSGGLEEATFPRNRPGPADDIITPAPPPLMGDGSAFDLSFFLNPVVIAGALFILCAVIFIVIMMIKKKDIDE